MSLTAFLWIWGIFVVFLILFPLWFKLLILLMEKSPKWEKRLNKFADWAEEVALNQAQKETLVLVLIIGVFGWVMLK